MEWISVNERLPKNRQKVLVTDINEEYITVAVYLVEEFEIGKERYFKLYMKDYFDKDKNIYHYWSDDTDEGDLKIGTFTHWMPLPKGPDKDK